MHVHTVEPVENLFAACCPFRGFQGITFLEIHSFTFSHESGMNILTELSKESGLHISPKCQSFPFSYGRL